jgi:hypothetical protein
MKEVIKKLLRENLLNERLTEIDDDVNVLYDNYFKDDIKRLKDTGMLNSDMFLPTETNTVILKSEKCVEANKYNSCILKINHGNNYYNPFNRTISVSVNSSLVRYIITKADGNISLATNMLINLTPNVKDYINQEFTEEKIKGSIHHELVHWIDDTLNNRHIRNKLNKAKEISSNNPNITPSNKPNINASKFEIQAQIHNIKQLHNKHLESWNNMSFKDMLNLSPVLSTINRDLKGDEKAKWLRDIKTRMYREGLLGNKMF